MKWVEATGYADRFRDLENPPFEREVTEMNLVSSRDSDYNGRQLLAP